MQKMKKIQNTADRYCTARICQDTVRGRWKCETGKCGTIQNARVENAGASSMESCLQKRVSMLSYRRANVLRVFFTDW